MIPNDLLLCCTFNRTVAFHYLNILLQHILLHPTVFLAILNNGVGFLDNPGLCYAPYSIKWEDILENPLIQPITLVPVSDGGTLTPDWREKCEMRYAQNQEEESSNSTTTTTTTTTTPTSSSTTTTTAAATTPSPVENNHTGWSENLICAP